MSSAIDATANVTGLQPAPKARPMRFESLQVFRGLAALAVVFYHVMCFTEDQSGFVRGMNWLIPGASGVDFFFVLSGFIICTAHLKDFGKRERLGTYGYRRFIRIYPLYLIFTIVMLMRAVFGLGRHVTPYTSSVIWKSFLLLPQSPGDKTIVVPGWTLTHEALFYIIFALLICFGPRVRASLISLFLAFTVINTISPWPAPYWVHTWLSSPYNLEFAAGCAATVVARYRVGWMLPAGLAALAASWTFISLTVHTQNAGQPATMVLLFGIPYWLIVTGAASLERSGRIVSLPRALVRLGDATYSIYLGHFFFAAVLTKVVFDHLHVPAFAIILVVSLLATAFGFAVYFFVEQPLLGLLRSFPRQESQGRNGLEMTGANKCKVTAV